MGGFPEEVDGRPVMRDENIGAVGGGLIEVQWTLGEVQWSGQGKG